MKDVSGSAEPVDVDEPTQPYHRSEIERLRRAAGLAVDPTTGAKPPSTDDGSVRLSPPPAAEVSPANQPTDEDDEWFELGGQRRHISLAAFTDIGSAGTPAGMRTSGEANLLSGEIGPARPCEANIDGSVELVDALELVDDDESPTLVRTRRRGSWRLLGGAGLLVPLVALGLWIGLRGAPDASDAPQPPTHPREAEPSEARSEPLPELVDAPLEPAPEREAAPDPVHSDAGPPESDARDDSASSTEDRRNDSRGPACAKLRKQADQALAAGEWRKLESLTAQRRCWQRSGEHKPLRMQALFELERYQECVDLGRHDKAREVKKWAAICQRALE